MEEERIFVNCECGCSGLLITEDLEFYGDKNEQVRQEFRIALYTHGEKGINPSLWNRIKYAWWHLKTGKKWNDCVIISDDNAMELIKFLSHKLSEKYLLAKQSQNGNNK